jgi:hypothetical protein
VTWTDWLGVIAFIAFIVISAIHRQEADRKAELDALKKKWKP